MTQLKISLHFVDWMAVLCAQPAQPQLLLCLGISQYLLTHYIQPVTHQCTFLCVCQTHVLEMWPSVSLRLDKLHVGVLQRCTNLPFEFHFHCSKSLMPSHLCSVSLSLVSVNFHPFCNPKSYLCTKVISLAKIRSVWLHKDFPICCCCKAPCCHLVELWFLPLRS